MSIDNTLRAIDTATTNAAERVAKLVANLDLTDEQQKEADAIVAHLTAIGALGGPVVPGLPVGTGSPTVPPNAPGSPLNSPEALNSAADSTTPDSSTTGTTGNTTGKTGSIASKSTK